jgi:hypothetical protein
MSEVPFKETSWLRLISVLCLGIANIILVADLWWMFFNFFMIALLFELLRRRLYEVLLYNYQIKKQNREFQLLKERNEHLNILKKMKIKV